MRNQSSAVGSPDGAVAGPADATAERVMACVSSNAHATRVIRAGAAAAARLGASWYAVYVETPDERPDRIGAADADALRRNLAAAGDLGATVVRVRAATSSDGLAAFARREGITHVVIGETARTRWEILLHGSPLDRFVSSVSGATVQVVPFE